MKGFKEIPDCNGRYLINKEGKVWSCYLKRFLKLNITSKGYIKAHLLYKGRSTNLFIHRLVMTTFSPIENMDELTINHKNGVKTDNKIGNLEWCTRRYNNRHAKEIGLVLRGEQRSISKLTEGEVKEIYVWYDYYLDTKKVTPQQIAKVYGVTYPTIHNIGCGRIWKHVYENRYR